MAGLAGLLNRCLGDPTDDHQVGIGRRLYGLGRDGLGRGQSHLHVQERHAVMRAIQAAATGSSRSDLISQPAPYSTSN